MRIQIIQAILLAWRDWKFQKLQSLCSVLALASMLTPILVLQGLKNGVIEGMRSRLLEDPAILIITPRSDAGRFTKEDIEKLASLPEAAYAVGRTRETAAELTLTNPTDRLNARITLEPASAGEPLLLRNNLPVPESGKEPDLILSSAAARTLKTKTGATLEARLNRKTPQGKFESALLVFHVTGILPATALEGKKALVSVQAMEDLENFWDFISVPRRGFSGRQAEAPRQYASFRLYAKNLDGVEILAQKLAEQKIEVITRAREIAGIRSLESAIKQVIFIISLAVGAGFIAFTSSSIQSLVARQMKMLGMLRLLGLFRLPLILYPVTQTLLTAFSGIFLSITLYLCVSLAIRKSFPSQGAISCLLPFGDFLTISALVIFLALCACSTAALKAGSVEPSTVIREV